MSSSSLTEAPERDAPPGGGRRTFLHLLANTVLANTATGYLWFAVTFWVYTETRNVMASGLIGALYLLLVAVLALPMGMIVDRFRTRRVLLGSAVVTVVTFAGAGVVLFTRADTEVLQLGGPWFWLFAGLVLLGAVCEQIRAIALSTLVTRLLPVPAHARANGLVGAAQGVTLIATSALSGITVAFLGIGWAWALATAATLATLIHLAVIRLADGAPTGASGAATSQAAPRAPADPGGWRLIRGIPGLVPLLAFCMLNNLIAGVYVALLDPYGLNLLPAQWWGLAFGLASTGMVVGGALVARFGLGRRPVRTMLLAVMLMGAVGMVFALRDWWILFVVGIWVYMALMPVVEATEQTVIQRIVAYRVQGRVFGAAMLLESAASPLMAFLVAPLAELVVIPYLESPEGAQAWGWLLGDGESRGIALIFVCAGAAAVILAGAAFRTRAYVLLARSVA